MNIGGCRVTFATENCLKEIKFSSLSKFNFHLNTGTDFKSISHDAKSEQIVFWCNHALGVAFPMFKTAILDQEGLILIAIKPIGQ